MVNRGVLMKALVKADPAPGLWLDERTIPEIGADDVLIKINKTGICGTDAHIYAWDEWARCTVPTPLIIGHEYAGVIVEVGSNVKRVSIGQRVTGEGHVVGTSSRAARGGRFHLDPETKGVGVTIPGAFAEYLCLPAFNVVPLPDAIDDEMGAILDPLGNAVHSALSFDLAGEDVLVTGAGPIGIMSAAVARHVGARHVVITDTNPYRLALATQVADVIPVDINKQDLRSIRDGLGMKEGFDVGLEMSGSPSAFDQMGEHLVMGGKVALLGIPSGPTLTNWARVIFKMLTVKGVYGREMFETWHKMLALLESGLNISKVITHRYDPSEFETAFEVMRNGSCGRIVLDWTALSNSRKHSICKHNRA